MTYAWAPARCLCGAATWPFFQWISKAKVPVSWPTHRTFIFAVGEVSIHGASERTSVSWMSWNTGRMSCGNAIFPLLSKHRSTSFGRHHTPRDDDRGGSRSGQEGDQLIGPGPRFG